MRGRGEEVGWSGSGFLLFFLPVGWWRCRFEKICLLLVLPHFLSTTGSPPAESHPVPTQERSDPLGPSFACGQAKAVESTVYIAPVKFGLAALKDLQ